MAKYCVNCGSILSFTNKCVKCGHESPLEYTERNFYKCDYSDGVRHCPAPGTMSPGLGGNGNWYCKEHFFARDDPEKSRQILDNYLTNGVPTEPNWRDEMMKNA